MPRVELFQHAVQLAANSLVLANSEDLGDLVGGQADNPNSPERSKILWIGKLRRKMELRQLCARPEYVAAVASR
jgi:hypothetical protein